MSQQSRGQSRSGCLGLLPYVFMGFILVVGFVDQHWDKIEAMLSSTEELTLFLAQPNEDVPSIPSPTTAPSSSQVEPQTVMYPSAGGHHIELVNSPDFAIEFDAIFQCREHATSNMLVEQYVMGWGIMHRDSRFHIKDSQISLELLSKAPYMSLMNGDELTLGVHLGAGHGAFVQAKDDGFIISGNGSQIGGTRLTFSETGQKIDVTQARSHYQTEIVIQQSENYNILPSYLQYNIQLLLINNGDMKMRDIQIVGVVAEKTGTLQDHILDLVQMSIVVPVIEEQGQQQIELKSPAYMDRCVQRQLTANEPRLHLWITYTSVDDNHVLTDYIEVESLQPGARGRG